MTTSPPFHWATQTGTHAHLAGCGHGRGALTYWASWERACYFCRSYWTHRATFVRALLPSKDPGHQKMLAESLLALFDLETGTSNVTAEKRLKAMTVLVGLFREATK